MVQHIAAPVFKHIAKSAAQYPEASVMISGISIQAWRLVPGLCNAAGAVAAPAGRTMLRVQLLLVTAAITTWMSNNPGTAYPRIEGMMSPLVHVIVRHG